MRKIAYYACLSFLAATLLGACAKDDPNLLIGSWIAYEVLEEGEKLDINASEIKLEFVDDLVYTYSSTLDYEEAGRYNVQSSYLYTTDTLSKTESGRKAVEIIQLTTDSLQLRMNDNGRERILRMLKEGGNPPSITN